MSDFVSINRENKSLLFSFIFGPEENKKHLLSLYNAINNTAYTNIHDIQINTLPIKEAVDKAVGLPFPITIWRDFLRNIGRVLCFHV